MNAPTIGRIEFAPYVVGADALKREQERSAALLAACRQVARMADLALTLRAPEQITADLQAIRRTALDAINNAKE